MDLADELAKLDLANEKPATRSRDRVRDATYIWQLQRLIHRKPSLVRAVLHQLAKANTHLAHMIGLNQAQLEALLCTENWEQTAYHDSEENCIDVFWPHGTLHGVPIVVRIANIASKTEHEFERECFDAFEQSWHGNNATWDPVEEVDQVQVYFDKVKEAEKKKVAEKIAKAKKRLSVVTRGRKTERRKKTDKMKQALLQCNRSTSKTSQHELGRSTHLQPNSYISSIETDTPEPQVSMNAWAVHDHVATQDDVHELADTESKMIMMDLDNETKPEPGVPQTWSGILESVARGDRLVYHIHFISAEVEEGLASVTARFQEI